MKKTYVVFITLFLMLSFVACGISSDNQNINNEMRQEEQVDEKKEKPSQKSDLEEKEVELSMVDSFIKKYNETASVPITEEVAVDVTDKESGHYRTEFRLGAFKDSIAKTGKIGEIVIDIVNCGWQHDELRIYIDGITAEQAVEIVKYASPIMDPDVPNDELQEVLDYLNGTNDYHNGYFGNLCMIFNNGELMLRTD